MAALRTALLAAALVGSPATAGPVDAWNAEITEASKRFDIPKRWIQHVIRAESSAQNSRNGMPIVSPAGAMGLMQLMPGTWLEMKAMLSLGSDPFNPRDNILAGTAYLRMMYDRFGYPGLFAAYNAGPTRYAAYLAGTRSLPSETKAYATTLARELRAPPVGRGPSPTLFAVRPSGAGASAPHSGLFVELDHDRQPEHQDKASGSTTESQRCATVNPGCSGSTSRSSAFALP